MKNKLPIIALTLLLMPIAYHSYQKFTNTQSSKDPIVIEKTQTNLQDIERLITEKQFQKAKQSLTKLLEVNKTNNEAIYLLAHINLILENNDLAEKYLQALTRLNKNQNQIDQIRFLLLYQKSQYQAAFKLLNKSKLPEKQFYKAILTLLQEDIIGSRQTLLKIQGQEFGQLSQKIVEDIALFETYQDANLSFLHAKVGKSLKDQNQIILAKKFLLKAISNQNQFRDAWLYLGHIYLESQKYSESLKIFEKSKQMSPYHPETHLLLGSNYYLLKQYDNAIKYLENAISFNTNEKAKALEFLGLSFYAQNKNTEALKNFQKSHQLQTLDLDSYANFIYLADNLNQTQQLESIYQRLQKVYPQKPMSLNLQGWIKLIQNQFPEAKQHLNQALKLDPYLAAAFLNLGQISIKEEKPKLAENYLEKANAYGLENNEVGVANKAKQLLQQL